MAFFGAKSRGSGAGGGVAVMPGVKVLFGEKEDVRGDVCDGGGRVGKVCEVGVGGRKRGRGEGGRLEV